MAEAEKACFRGLPSTIPGHKPLPAPQSVLGLVADDVPIRSGMVLVVEFQLSWFCLEQALRCSGG